MENIGGGLGYRASLDIDDFKVSSEAMAQYIRKASQGIQSEAQKMDDTIMHFAKNGAMYITSFLVGQGMMSLVQSIIQTRGQFQQLEIAFETMLGSADKAHTLMSQMTDTAAKTPFDLKGVAEGAKQLLAYGMASDKVNETLVRLGNIASGLSIPLNDIVYLYGTTMVQGRLYAQDVRQFTGRGIPLVRELAAAYGVTAEEINAMVSAGKIGFADVEKVLNKLTDAGGQFYNLMEKQSASLTGMISNLEDAFDMALDKLGTEFQDVLGAGINTASFFVEGFVENFDKIAKIVKGAAIAFGSYKAALILTNLATKGVTGVALIDNTVRQSKIALLKLEAVATGKVAAQTTAMEQAMAASTAAMEAQLTQEQLLTIQKQVRAAAIASLLTTQQAEYLSNLGLTTSSVGYEAAALGVFSVEQKLALSKMDLTNKSEAYRMALEAQIATTNREQTANIGAMRTEVKKAAMEVESAKETVLAKRAKLAALKQEQAELRASGAGYKALNMQEQINAAQDELNAAIKAKYAAITDFNTKKTNLETAAKQRNTAAGRANAITQSAQAEANSTLAKSNTILNGTFKTLWATIKANPFGWLLTIVSLVATAFLSFSDATEENVDEMGEFNEETTKQIRLLNLYFDILQNTEKGTKTHKDALEKVNQICQEYNKTLLDENATLEKQKEKYDELTKAIQQNTAEKIKAKYLEEAANTLNTKDDKAFETFEGGVDKLKYSEKTKTGRNKVIAAEHINNMEDEVRESIRSLVNVGSQELSKLTGPDYWNKYNEIVTNIMTVTANATGANEKEMAGFEVLLKDYLDRRILDFKAYNKEVDRVTENTNKMFATPSTNELAESTDYAKMSFEELEAKIKKAQDEIDLIEKSHPKVEVDADTAKLDELTQRMEMLNSLSEAQKKLNQEITDADLSFNSDIFHFDVDSIREMGGKVQFEISQAVRSGAEELSRLAGDEYTKRYDEVINAIMSSTQKATNATDDEMAKFRGILDGYLTEEIGYFHEFDGSIATAINTLKTLFGFDEKDGEGLQNSTEITNTVMGKLTDTILSTQKEIDVLNGKKVAIDTDNTRLLELKALIDEIKGAIATNSDNLNTENGISARIKKLKEERGDVEINSARYKELTDEIERLQKRIPSHTTGKGKGGNSTANKAEQLREKQLEAERRAEEARISIMKEGYDKRKALLDLQHKENLDRIDKEQRELEKARREAGKGGLTKEELQGFEDRRIAENYSYSQEQTRLFDGEIDYMKKQYELYFRWVSNMGREVADKQFEDLLKNGNSYKDYVERQIRMLTIDDGVTPLDKRQGRADLTEGQVNMLNGLKAQYNEIMGVKSAMDLFKESLKQAVAQSSSLAERMEAVAKAKDDLANGRTGIVGDDEKAQALLYLNEQDEQLQQELQTHVLTSYRTFEQQRLSIQNQFALERKTAEELSEKERQAIQEQMERMRQAAIEVGNTEELQKIDELERMRLEAQSRGDEERLAQINRAEQQALSELNGTFLKQTDSWRNLFSNLDTLSVGEIEKLIADIEKELNRADLKLNPVDYKAVIDSLEQAKQKLIDKNPFKALGTFYDDYNKAKQKLALAKDNLAKGNGTQDDVNNAEREVKAAAAGITKSIGEVTEMATNCAQSLQGLFDSFGMDGVAEGIGTAIELMGELGTAAQSVGQLMSGDIIGGITGLVSSVSSVIGIFNGLHDKKYEKQIKQLQKQIDGLERSYNRLDRAFNNTYWVFSDEQRNAYDKNLSLINQQIAALEREREVARQSWDFVRYAQLTQQIKDLKASLIAPSDNEDMFTLYNKQKENLKQQQVLLREQIQAEKSKKKTDDSKIQQWEDAIESIDTKLEDLEKQMMETLAGTSVQSAIDEFADAITEAFLQGENAAESLGKKTKEVLRNAVVEALKRQFLAKAINDAVEYLASAMEDNELTDYERQKFEDMVNAGGEAYRTALEGIGDWIKDLDDISADPLTGAIQGMSEETAGVIAGRLNAFIINQAEQTQVLREALILQSQIANNTQGSWLELQEIRATLKRIETKDNSLLSQGIA